MSGTFVLSRSAPAGRTKRTWLLPRVISGVAVPHSPRGRTTKRTRGCPTSGRTRRTSCDGRNARSRRMKRGQKSTTSMPSPVASNRRVRKTAVLGSYACSDRANPSSSTRSTALSDMPFALSSKALKIGSPSNRGMQHQTIPACRSTSAPMAQLPISARSRLAGTAGMAIGFEDGQLYGAADWALRLMVQ